MAIDRVLSLHPALLVPAFLAVQLALDWATYIPSFAPLGITPWNPCVGLAIGFVLLKGPPYLPVLAIGTLLSDVLVRGLPLPLESLLVEVAAASVIYMIGLGYLWRSRPPFDPDLGTVGDLLRLIIVATVAAAGVAAAYVGGLVWAGHLPAAEFTPSALRYFVGDTIGIIVVTPFLLLARPALARWTLSLETAAQLAAVVLAVVVVFGFAPGLQTQLSYALFLPIVWIALRRGLEGVAAALVVMQVAIMIALHIGKQDAVNVTEVQAVMLVLACAGLAIGVLVRERARAEQSVRLQQVAIARAARIGTMDRLTTSIAHEINQPLTAIGNYCRAAVRALDAGPGDVAAARDAAAKAAAQVERAAVVIQRLRALYILGRAELAPARVERLIRESIELVQPELAAASVKVSTAVARGLPEVSVDLLQAEQLVTNVLRNAIEAMHDVPRLERQIRIEARTSGTDQVEVQITDAGPGFPAGFRLSPDVPSQTTKKDGLGIGLTLCQSIAVAHGGRIQISEAGRPGSVTFTLRAARATDHTQGEAHVGHH